MSPLRLIILLVAAGAAIAAVFLVRSMQAPAPAVASAAPIEAVHAPAPSRQILIAKKDISVGHFLVADDLAWLPWPENTPTKSFLMQKDAPDALEKSVGAVAKVAIAAGEPLTLAKIAHPGGGGWMSAILTPGMRAVSIEITAETAAGGFIQPNDHVDVIVTREVEAQAGGGTGLSRVHSQEVLENVRVLAIDAIYSAPKREGEGGVLLGTRATLELSEQDATLINAAQKAGRLALALRSIADLQTTGPGASARKALRQGGDQNIRIFRYGVEASTPVPTNSAL